MKLLVIGSGGREHALAWKLAQGPRVQKGLRRAGQRRHRSGARAGKRRLERDSRPWFLLPGKKAFPDVVGPEAPLAAAWSTRFPRPGSGSSAPTRAAAQLESSKDFAKSFMCATASRPPANASFERAADRQGLYRPARRAHRRQGDGLAGGKGRGGGGDARRGACRDRHDAHRAAPGRRRVAVVIEDFSKAKRRASS